VENCEGTGALFTSLTKILSSDQLLEIGEERERERKRERERERERERDRR
jgi:hypothetical protein